jgi:hypothetical protein
MPINHLGIVAMSRSRVFLLVDIALIRVLAQASVISNMVGGWLIIVVIFGYKIGKWQGTGGPIQELLDCNFGYSRS